MIEKYKNYLIVNGKSQNTIVSYTDSIKDLLKKIKIENLTKETLSNYFLELKKSLSANSVNISKSAVRSFLKFLDKDILVPQNDKIVERLPEFITEKYFEDNVIPVIESVSPNPLKYKAILYFMFYTGLRVGEITLLKRENIDLDKRVIKFYIPKGKKERLGLIVSKKAKQFIQDYFSVEPETTNAFNISYYALKQWFKGYKSYFKDVNFHPHLFRHCFGTYCRKIGIPLEDIKELMGHSNIQTTMIYAHVNIDDIKKRCDEAIKHKRGR
jgi:site-specific recombinase XerD